MAGTGNGLTVTLYCVGKGAVQPLALVKFTDTVLAPAVFQETVMELLPAPAVMVPPAETVQRYPVIPV